MEENKALQPENEAPAEAPAPVDAALPEPSPAPAQDAEPAEALPLTEENVKALAAALLDQMKPTEEELKAEKAAQKAAMKQRRRKRRAKQIRGFFIRLALLAVVVYVLFYQIVGVTVMPSEDMYPRIDSGDVVLFYRLDRDVRAQDVIVFTKDAGLIQTTTAFYEEAGEAAPAEDEPEETQKGFWASVGGFFHNAALKLGIIREENEQLFICRVVAVAGDTVEITEGGSLVVNGNHVVESNIFSQTTVYEGFTEYPLTLKAGECFVLADKRNGGADSRFFGAVYTEDILGTVITIVRRNSL